MITDTVAPGTAGYNAVSDDRDEKSVLWLLLGLEGHPAACSYSVADSG